MSEVRRAGNALTEQDKTDIRRDIGLGTAAVAAVPPSGNASSSQVVLGNDTRLTDARTPTSHTHTASQVTDFSEAADARIAAASINALADVTVTSPTSGQVLKWSGTAWVNDTDATGGGGGAGTDLAYTASSTNGIVTSNTGADATLPLVDGTNAGLMAPAQHTKLAGIATGATANSADAELLARANHTGEQAISTVTGLQTALNAKLDGSDASVTNAREWTAETITQAEAEAGTATTRRAFTAQRVFQAIAAWWTSISTVAGRALVTAADAPTQRTALGLGTAATTAASAYATAAQGSLAGTAVQPGAVTGSGLTQATARLLGRSTSGTGAVEEITLGTNLSFTGTTLNAAGGGGSPGGADGQIQRNNAGAFAGSLLNQGTNIIEQRNGTAAQTFRLYNTFTDPSNHERGFMRWASNTLEIGAEAAGTGAARNTAIVANGAQMAIFSNNFVAIATSGANTDTRWFGGAMYPLTTNATDSGTASNRWKHSFLSGFCDMLEIADPAAGAANTGRIYTRDNGSGKTQLCVRFATGAIQVLATEP